MLLSLALTLAALFISRTLWRRWNFDLHKIPSAPGVPLLGHTLDFLIGQGSEQFSQLLGGWRKRLGYPKVIRVETPVCLAQRNPGASGDGRLALRF